MKRPSKQLLLPPLLALISAVGCNILPKSEPKSGTELLLQLETDAANREHFVELTKRIIEVRADAIGANVKLERKDSDKIILRIGTTPDMERLKKFLLSYARLEIRAVVSPPAPSPVQTYPSFDEAKTAVKEGEEVLPYVEHTERAQYVIVKGKPIVANEDVRDARAVPSDGSSYEIIFSLKPDGAARFGEWTAANINNYLAVALNKEVKSVAYIRSQVTDSGAITGSFTKLSAEDLALVLKSGSLPAPIKVLEEKTFGK